MLPIIKKMKKLIIQFSILFLLLFFISNTVFAEGGILSIPDSSDQRAGRLMESWITAPVTALVNREAEVFHNRFGQVFQIRSEVIDNEIAIVIAPRDDQNRFVPEGKENELDYHFLAESAGGWVLYRDIETGKFLRINVYFQNDCNVYAVLRPCAEPKKPKASIDLIVYGAYAARNVPLGLPFEQLASLSFSELYTLTKDTIPWHYVRYDARKYSNIIAMVNKIRENLPRIEYVDDAGYDENEQPVFLSTGEPRSGTPGKISLSCSGFTKWIIDGLTVGLNNKVTRIDVLKTTTVPFDSSKYSSAVVQQNYYRSFDWIRNLSSAALTAAMDRSFIPGTGGTDVKIEPFAADETEYGTKRLVGFMDDTGYSIDMLKPLFFILAATEPDVFYLGSIKVQKSTEPETWAFHHDLAFFPYFDASGVCRVAVFEGGVETDFESFIERNKGTFVYLCRVKASDHFDPL